MKAKYRAWLPNLLTYSNLFLGFFAIVLFSQGRYIAGAWMLAIAAITDGLDGAAARLVKSSSKFGGEFDSLADVVSFGVGPSVLAFHMLYDQLGLWAVAIASLHLLTAATRLAKYNVLTESQGHSNTFSGMPSPAAALIPSSFFIWTHHNAQDLNTIPIWIMLVPLISLLMISPIPYRRIPVVQIHGARHPALSIAVIIGAAALLLIDTPLFMFPLMLIYLLTGPVEWIVHHTVNIRERLAGRINIVEVGDSRRSGRRTRRERREK